MRHISRIFFVLIFTALSMQAEGANDTLKKIKQTGVITISYREASIPFSYLDEQKKPIGYTIDLCMRLTEAIRTALELPKLQINWIPAKSVPVAITYITENKADLECGSTTNTKVRRDVVTFTMPIYIAGIKIMSHKSLAANDMHQLSNKKVAANIGTTAAKLVEATNQMKLSAATLVETKDHNDAFQKLESGQVDAWLTDDVLLYSYRAAARTPEDFVISNRFLTSEPYGIMFQKDDAAMKKILNGELFRLINTGEFNKIYAKWFESPIPPKNISIGLKMNLLLKTYMSAPSEDLPANY
ncbi:amino acid ABC transporter substrate-binding protein [Collimonas silvisoli]|uniref:amino acid ABC transporter substrate-binding protein n=1 Tax=Collimonas silvisoli TaxID=2825884 RepID=UPI001B8B1412|nr:amino acid ABC transporter substrate-binding protein [Collimonas silvisoli]